MAHFHRNKLAEDRLDAFCRIGLGLAYTLCGHSRLLPAAALQSTLSLDWLHSSMQPCYENHTQHAAC